MNSKQPIDEIKIFGSRHPGILDNDVNDFILNVQQKGMYEVCDIQFQMNTSANFSQTWYGAMVQLCRRGEKKIVGDAIQDRD